MYRTFSSVCCPYLFESVYTASTGSVFLATGKLSNSTYINELIQFFRSGALAIVGLGLVVELGSVLVYFIFCIFFLSSVG